MILQWLSSKTVRHALGMCKHVQKILNHQRDILSWEAVKHVEEAISGLKEVITSGAEKSKMDAKMTELEAAANNWLKPYPSAAWRENVEVLLVALAVAMGIRTFFLQPFKIPTGSMQPTLFGVNSTPDFSRPYFTREDADAGIAEQVRLRDEMKVPTGFASFKEWLGGASYVHVVAENDGALESVSQPLRLLIFNIKQTLRVGGKSYTMWFPPDYGSGTLEKRAGIQFGQVFHKGEDIVKIRVNAGDHLFVDRMTYNFAPPSRGQIIVFETKGIDGLPQDQFYIKRLVALSGEKVQIGDDRHLIMDGQRLDASTPHFEYVYSFDPKKPARDSQFSGHVNQKNLQSYQPAARYNQPQIFSDESTSYTVRTDHLMVMGDNTMNSLDSRYWSDFPAGNVIGRAFTVYWPITDRFGWACVAH